MRRLLAVNHMAKARWFHTILPSALLIFFSWCWTPAAHCGQLTVMTENYPPYQYLENGRLKGPAVRIVREIMRRLHSTAEIQLMPWGRAFRTLKRERAYVLFSVTRTPQREKQFKWVGPLVSFNMSFYKKKGSPIILKKIEDAKRYIVGVGNKSPAHFFLMRHKFPMIVVDYIDRQFSLPRMLQADRIDLWLTGDPTVEHMARMAGVDPSQIEQAMVVMPQELYIAFSRVTSDKVIKRWQEVLNQIKFDGTYTRFMEELQPVRP